jgi:2-methylisocitrate lyase-like PEP mutase family enzyme
VWDADSAQSVLEAGAKARAVDEAIERANASAAAGASAFFIPGLTEDALVGQLCEVLSLPLNVMIMGRRAVE